MTVSRETSLMSGEDFLVGFHKRLYGNVPEESDLAAFSGLTFSALALTLLSSSKFTDCGIVVVCEDSGTAELLYRFCYNFPDTSAYYFPETDESPAVVPGFNLEQERFRSELYNLLFKPFSGLIITTANGMALPIINKTANEKIDFDLSAGKKISRKQLLDTLQEWGYELVDKTVNPKTFAVRGGLLDIFLLYSLHPVRIEFFGDTVESIRVFNPMSQRTVGQIGPIEILPPPDYGNHDHPQTTLKNVLKDVCQFLTVTSENNTFSISCNPSLSPPAARFHSFDFKQLDKEQREQKIISVTEKFSPENIFIFAENATDIKKARSLFPENCSFVKSSLEKGFFSEELDLCVFSLAEIYRRAAPVRQRWALESFTHQPQRSFTNIDEIQWDDYLVHQDFGIGQYKGLETIQSKKGQHECIKIEYADGGNIYVPVEKFDKVHKLLSIGKEQPRLSALGSSRWERQKQKVKSSAQQVVHDLVHLYSSRRRLRGFRYAEAGELDEALAATFPYDETPDQSAAITTVAKDMESDYPMDRLICGDVGFGKTEVALRAAMKAVISGKKVLFLTPTTILADQHYISSTSRLDPLGVQVELLSRFKTKSEQKIILEKMLTGSVDLVIGTHRLLSEDIHFPGLGFLIIDEEHRFGVRHKEKLKQLKTTVDVLTLSATPIPRTLQQSLMGIREISRISTPPKTRKPIQTYVRYFDWSAIRQAISLELAREGQVYFLHNDIKSLPFYFEKLEMLFPEASIAIAHGQMHSKKLERVVLSFFDGNLEILLCTTIIESGLDVPNANTIIIDTAQKFGLAQLYQIRGRVGRGHRQAYCYLLLPKGKSLGNEAFQRLKAIEQHTSLGSGYDIALKDLEIRGAGNLFGYKQSGQIAAVGFEMYCKLLQEAVDETTNKERKPQHQVKIVFDDNALLDNSYMPLVQDRLYFYQRLSESNNVHEVQDVRAELRDRFGPLPKAVENLILISELRLLLTNTSVDILHIKNKSLAVTLRDLCPFTTFQDFVAALANKMLSLSLPWRFIQNPRASIVFEITTGGLRSSLTVSKHLVELYSV